MNDYFACFEKSFCTKTKIRRERVWSGEGYRMTRESNSTADDHEIARPGKSGLESCA